MKEQKKELFFKEFCEAEYSSDKPYSPQGIMIQAGIWNKNGRLYDPEATAKAVEKYQSVIKNNKAVGELKHRSLEETSTEPIDIERISHKITYLQPLTTNKNNYYGQAEICDTPKGKIVKALIDSKIQLGFSSRITCAWDELEDGRYMLYPTEITTAADIVWDNSFPDAAMLTKSTEFLESFIHNSNLESLFNTEIGEATIREYKEDRNRKENAIKHFYNIIEKFGKMEI